MIVIRFIFTASTDPKESSQVHQVLMCWRPEDLGSVGHRHQGDQGTFAIVYIFNPSPVEYLFIYHSIQAAISNAISSLKPRQIFIFMKYRHLSVEFILPTDHFSKNILYITLGMNFAFNPLTAGAAYIRVFFFYQHIRYHILNMLKINQQDLKRVDLYFVKSE